MTLAIRVVWRYLVPFMIGAVLIGAAVLKSLPILFDPRARPRVFGSFVLEVALIDTEAIFGLALCLGTHLRIVRLLCMVVFSAFFVVAFTKGLSGEQSCACFDKFNVSPWATAGFDVCAVVALVIWKPAENRSSFRLSCFIFSSLLFLSLVPLSRIAHPSSSGTSALATNSPRTSIGKVGSGARHVYMVALQNPRDVPVVVDRLESSCPCVKGRDLPWHFSPREKKHVSLELDLSNRPSFSGELLLQISGLTQNQSEALRAEIHVDVFPQ